MSSTIRWTCCLLLLALGACADDSASKSGAGIGPRDAGGETFADAGADALPDANAAPDGGTPDAVTDAVPLAPFPTEISDALDDLLAGAPRAVSAPGVSVYVSVPGSEPWSGAAGFANADTEAPVQPADRFRVGSITKTFNATVTLMLVDEGMVGLDDRVDDWVPGYDFGPDITVATLLDHTSGIFNYTDDASFVPMAVEATTPSEVIAFAEDHGRVHNPGQAYSYSNTGYFLLGLIIEAATGQTFAEAVRERLLDPLGLEDTFVQPDESDADFVDGHVLGTVGTDLIDMSWAWAAGGMISNGADLCAWAGLLFDGDVLPEPVREEMIGPSRLPDGSAAPYGYGVRHTVRGGAAVIGHTGSTIGFRGELFFERESGTCVAVLTNDFFADPTRFANQVWSEVLSR